MEAVRVRGIRQRVTLALCDAFEAGKTHDVAHTIVIPALNAEIASGNLIGSWTARLDGDELVVHLTEGIVVTRLRFCLQDMTMEQAAVIWAHDVL